MAGGSWGPPRSRRLWRAAFGLSVAAAVIAPTVTSLPAAAAPAHVATTAARGVPPSSGSGRRVVYSRSQQRVWAVDSNGRVVNTHPVSGRRNSPSAGTYHVFSRSATTYAKDNPAVTWRYMVRFAHGPNGGNIGFHEIPTKNGRPLQSTGQLGQALSAGCVRQSHGDAVWMWNWAGIGTKVVVL